MEKIKIELRKISKTVAKIEVEHGEKLQILFDAFKVHDQNIVTKFIILQQYYKFYFLHIFL